MGKVPHGGRNHALIQSVFELHVEIFISAMRSYAGIPIKLKCFIIIFINDFTCMGRKRGVNATRIAILMNLQHLKFPRGSPILKPLRHN